MTSPAILTTDAIVELRRMKASVGSLEARVQELQGRDDPQPQFVARTPTGINGGIPPMIGDEPGEKECEIVRRWGQNKYLSPKGTSAGKVKVYNALKAPIPPDTNMVCAVDTWGDLWATTGHSFAVFFRTSGAGVGGTSNPLQPTQREAEMLQYISADLLPYSPSITEFIGNPCPLAVDGDVIVQCKLNFNKWVIDTVCCD